MYFKRHTAIASFSLPVLCLVAVAARGQVLTEGDIREVLESDAMKQAFEECVSGSSHPPSLDLVLLIDAGGSVTLLSVEPGVSGEIFSCLQAAAAGASFQSAEAAYKVIIPVAFPPDLPQEGQQASGPASSPAAFTPPPPKTMEFEPATAPKTSSPMKQEPDITLAAAVELRPCSGEGCLWDDQSWKAGSNRMIAGTALTLVGELALAISIGFLAKVRSEQGNEDCGYHSCESSPAEEHVGAEYGLLAASLVLKSISIGLLASGGNYHYAAASKAGVMQGRGPRGAGYAFLILSMVAMQLSLPVLLVSVEATTGLLYTASFLQSFAAVCFLAWDITLRRKVRGLSSTETALVPVPAYAFDPRTGTHAFSVSWRF